MRVVSATLAGGVVVATAVLLAMQGMVLLRDGVARNNAVPVPTYLTAGRVLPLNAYRSAASALAGANEENGNSAIFAAEAALLAGEAPQRVAASLKTALTHSPASVRGWTLLSKAEFKSHSADAVRSLTTALMLGPYDFWTLGERVRLSAQLWDRLSADSKAQALAQTRLLWSEPELRSQLQLLAASPKGGELITRAFQGQEGAIREINRWLRGQSLTIGMSQS